MANEKTVVVTGGGSGVGRAVAIQMAAQGWRVAITGRRQDMLAETVRLAGDDGKRIVCCQGDVSQPADVERLKASVDDAFGGVDALVNSAGINVPDRKFSVLTEDNYRKVLEVNLTGAFLCVQAFLAGMRERQAGTIVNIVSEAGRYANRKAGASYIMSKFGMDGLTAALNIEERENGIRACSVFPGDINTPILDKRPEPPPADVRERMIQPEDIAACVALVLNLPGRTTVEEILVRPTRFTT